MALCLLAHKHGVDTDGCETKAAVIQSLLDSDGKKAAAGPPSTSISLSPLTSVPPAAAPAWGEDALPDEVPVEEVSQAAHYIIAKRSFCACHVIVQNNSNK